MTRTLKLAAAFTLLFAPAALAQGVPGATPSPPAQPNTQRPDQWQRHWNTKAFNGSGAAPAGENGASGSAGGHWNTNAFAAHPAGRAGGQAFGTTAFGNGEVNAFGRNKPAHDNANRMAGSFATQKDHGKWFGTSSNPPETAPRQ